ncbi:GAF domain-containing SpoIIE family protein phosphatase [Pseudonocardia sp. UM4_GMWB1]|uniref:GAF domain-containing SpoIIE family protein phosphatase n=1 Tax=unclassified Pseudonocardia TaxID=2619320 RepID=UPI000918D43D|nr:GAF domain-containing SpoIIE family protein phosphatase [Pseudonocardia sp. SID8383]MYW70881.1 SpoIIE family protein phosphatase [Pseudonocardia sp. SID8383]OJG05566.1 Stage II sporulation protein E (SpoIIE) [Pseudonocardia autotrophica]
MPEDITSGTMEPAPECAALYSPERLTALRRSGLGSESDPEMERFAAWVRRALATPIALVTLVQPDRQVFPGMAGLTGPAAIARSTPLTHSFCQYVVTSGQSLVIADARMDPRFRDNLAIPDLGVIAYAGMPLTDEHGRVLGSLCAIDNEPRRWTAEETIALGEIARSCSTELRLRLARYDTSTETILRAEADSVQRRAHLRGQMLLRASQSFTDTSTVPGVRARIDELLGGELAPSYVETVLRDRTGRLHSLPADARSPAEAGDLDGAVDIDPTVDQRLTTTLRVRTPAAIAIREQRVVHYGNQDDLAAAHPAEAAEAMRRRGVHTVVAAPVPGRGAPAGAILLGWDRPDAVETADLLTIATIAGYAGQALERARDLHHRTSVAHEMQNAMLTVLPDIDGLTMAARYIPADARLNVGGDWYDATVMTHPGRPDVPMVGISVGDIVGHDLPAVTLMGQTRSMLRQAAWDHSGRPPSTVLSAFETANHELRLGAAGTAVLAYTHRTADGRWLLRWTNAGHPPPILIHPDGSTELLTDHDALFGFDFTIGQERADHERVVEPGSTLLLHTDGLVDGPGLDVDTATDALLATIEQVSPGTPDDIVDAVMATLSDPAHDDAVALAIHFDAPAPAVASDAVAPPWERAPTPR